MTSWRKEEIEIADGTKVLAQMPVIVSASRSTDIPAFYSDWFMERLNAGYVKWFNPFNGVPLYVGFKKMRCIVFWSKNPRPMLALAALAMALVAFGVARLIVKKTVNRLLAQPADAIFGALTAAVAAFGVSVAVLYLVNQVGGEELQVESAILRDVLSCIA